MTAGNEKVIILASHLAGIFYRKQKHKRFETGAPIQWWYLLTNDERWAWCQVAVTAITHVKQLEASMGVKEFKEVFGDLLEWATSPSDESPPPEELAQKLGRETEVWVNDRINQMVIVLPENVREQARSMLRRFAEECFAKGAESAMKVAP